MTKAEARFHELLRELGEHLSRAIRRARPADVAIDVDDVAQEVRLRLWRLACAAEERDLPRAYLYRVATHLTLDAARRSRRRREDSLADSAVRDRVERQATAGGELRIADPEAVDRQLRLGRAIATALAHVAPPRGRAAALYLQGFTVPQVARLCGWSSAKARNLVFRGLADLRVVLRREGWGEDEL